jgi:hypothetical protein
MIDTLMVDTLRVAPIEPSAWWTFALVFLGYIIVMIIIDPYLVGKF